LPAGGRAPPADWFDDGNLMGILDHGQLPRRRLMPLPAGFPIHRLEARPAAPHARIRGLSAEQREAMKAIGSGVLLGVSYVAAIIGIGLWVLHH
jgi:hypothetical protein